MATGSLVAMEKMICDTEFVTINNCVKGNVSEHSRPCQGDRVAYAVKLGMIASFFNH